MDAVDLLRHLIGKRRRAIVRKFPRRKLAAPALRLTFLERLRIARRRNVFLSGLPQRESEREKQNDRSQRRKPLPVDLEIADLRLPHADQAYHRRPIKRAST